MIGIFFTARLGSTRLPQKHLFEAAGKPFIKWLVDRYLSAFADEIKEGLVELFIVTSAESQNQKFEEVFNNDQTSVFFGSNDNIPLRHLQCAEAYTLKYIISIDGDDILCSTAAARQVKEALLNGKDMAQTKGLPLGMNVMGYSTDFLRRCLKNKEKNKFETGWGKIFVDGDVEIIDIEGFECAQNLRMTLDYALDADFFRTVIENIGQNILSISDDKLVNQIIEKNWGDININLNQEYWDNFNKQKLE